MSRWCEGCGIQLQAEDPRAAGYVPPHVLQNGSRGIVCRRCYRIEHYGQEDQPEGVFDRALDLVTQAMDEANLVLMIVDIVDFEGSFSARLARRARGRLVVAVNKIDLLPKRTTKAEVHDWVAKRLEAEGVAFLDVALISSSKGEGTQALKEFLVQEMGGEGSLAIVGATNVGKSTLLSHWLQDQGNYRPPTVSRFPGTTLGLIRRRLPQTGMTMVDTPGIIPRGRISDLVCAECSAKLVASQGIGSKLYQLKEGQALLFGGLAGVAVEKIEGDGSTVIIGYGSKDVKFQRTREDRMREHLAKGDEKLYPPCQSCSESIRNSGWEEISLTVGEKEDIAVLGLGWVSVRKGQVTLRVVVPAGAQVGVRPRLLGPKGSEPPQRRRGNRRRPRWKRRTSS